MDPVLDLDRRIVLALARALRDVQRCTKVPVHAVAFWSATALYMLSFVALARSEDRLEWTWYLLFFGFGLIGSYVSSAEPVALVEPGIALTGYGADRGWAVTRVSSLPAALVVWLLTFASGGMPVGAAIALLGVIHGLMLLEYLLAFRLVGDDHPLVRQHAAMAEFLRAAAAGQETPKAE
ncbi:MAG: hypothetical protein HYU66_10695 [Armatimonadetes bacterium]|nr:hypothetical protein [Armatimonadota bacterium]